MTTATQGSVRASQEQGLQSGSGQSKPDVNVGRVERMASGVVGLLMVKSGIKGRSTAGLVTAAIGGMLIHRAATGHCGVYEAVGIDTAAGRPAEPNAYFKRGIHVAHSFTVNKPASELYAFWRDFQNLPRFMKHLQSVTVTDEKHSHWIATAPRGRTVEWDAEIINEQPDRIIAWRSLGNADVDNTGSVRFVDLGHDRGTAVHVTLDYIPPAGRVGSIIAWLFGEAPEQTVRDDLRRFKALMEAGEIPTTDGQSRGQC